MPVVLTEKRLRPLAAGAAFLNGLSSVRYGIDLYL